MEKISGTLPALFCSSKPYEVTLIWPNAHLLIEFLRKGLLGQELYVKSDLKPIDYRILSIVVWCRSSIKTQIKIGVQNAVKKRVNRIFSRFTVKVAIVKTRITRFLTVLRAPKITSGHLSRVNFGALRKRKYSVKGCIIIRFLPIIVVSSLQPNMSRSKQC